MKVLANDIHSLVNGGGCRMFAGFDKMFDLAKDPGITDSSAADHDAVNTITVFILQCFFRSIDITVAKDGDCDTWIIFNPGNRVPVGNSFIQLASRPSMN